MIEMKLISKLRKIGNSLCVIIPSKVIKKIRAEEGDDLEIRVNKK